MTYDITIARITDENREAFKKIAIANAESNIWRCLVCHWPFLQAHSQYWKVHEHCMDYFTKNKEYYLALEERNKR